MIVFERGVARKPEMTSMRSRPTKLDEAKREAAPRLAFAELPAPYWIFGLVVFVAILAFEPALRNSLTHDDVAQVGCWRTPMTPRQWLAATWEPWWPASRLKHDWRPATRLTILAQQALQGSPGTRDPGKLSAVATDPLDARPFYALNIALHALECVLLMALALRWGMGRMAALIAALLFAAHPLQAEAVHQIVGRAELLAAIFMMTGLLLWTRWSAAGAHAFWQQPICFALALGSKEHAALYPLFLALAALAGPVGGLAEDRGWRRWSAPGRRPTLRLAVLFLMLGLILGAFVGLKAKITGGLIASIKSISHAENILTTMSFPERLPAALGGMGHAVERFFWLARMAPDYSAFSLPYGLGWGWPCAWLGLAVVAAIAVGSVVNARKGGRGWAVAVAGLASWLLTSNIPFVMATSPAPRLWHWPLASVCLGAGWAMTAAFAKLRVAHRERLLALTTALVVVALLAATWRDAPSWRSPKAFAAATLKIYPDCWRAHIIQAGIAYDENDFETGLVNAEAATRVFPREAQGWGLVGINAMRLPGQERERQAEAALRQAIALGDVATAPRNLANFLRKHDRLAEAEALGKRFPGALAAKR
jgi:hypothetical protein